MLLKELNIDITLAKDALDFSKPDTAGLNKIVDEEFKKLVNSKFNELLNKYPKISESYHNLSQQHQQIIMYSPEVLKVLFNSDNVDNNESLEFFLSMLIEAEKSKTTHKFDTEKFGTRLWSANGAYMISYNETENNFTTFNHPTLSDTTIPQDYFSHFNIANSSDKQHYSSDQLKPSLYSFEEAGDLAETINQTFDKLDKSFQKFISTYTNVLMLKKTLNEKIFTSGTDSMHINRVIICNGHTVDQEVLADALIHEATHGLLTIIDIFNQWQPSRDVSHEFGKKIHSPWTNNLLTIRNLVQATYVWYALYNFWNTFPINFSLDYAKERVTFIKDGFKKLDFTPYKTLLSPTTFSELTAIKNKIV